MTANTGRLRQVERVLVIGAAGSGKTTVGEATANLLCTQFVDLDALFWEPGWRPATPEAFLTRVKDIARTARWVIAGNYTGQARDLLWPLADTVVWLDLPRRTSFRRVVSRTFRGALGRQELWPGCRQTPGAAFENGLFRAAWQQPQRYRARYESYLSASISSHLDVVRLRTPAEVNRWLLTVSG